MLVKEVKAKKLPDLDDEFARVASEFETLEELRADVREKLGRIKEAAADAGVRDRALHALIEKVDVELPERLVDRETESRVESARQRAEQQGTTLEAILQASGVDELEFRSDARAHAVRALRADFGLEAVARAEEISVEKRELDETVAAIARDAGRDVKEVRKILEGTGQITSVAGDIIRKKALDHVVEHARVVGAGSDDEPPSEGKDQ